MNVENRILDKKLDILEEEEYGLDNSLNSEDVLEDISVDEIIDDDDKFSWKETSEIINYKNLPEYFHPKIFKLNSKHPYDYFNLMFSDEIISLISEQTNIYANDFIVSNTEYLEKYPNSRVKKWKNVNNEDIKALIAVYIIMGINKFPDITGK